MKQKFWLFAFLLGIAVFRVQADGFLTAYDREIVATCLVLEAGGEGSDGMQAVLNVILNRADGYLHRMVQQTIKPGAFSCMAPVWNRTAPNYSPLINQAMNQPGAYKTALRLIDIMEQGLLFDNTGGATHYHADSIHPYWADSLRYLTTIGRHIFYVERGREMALL